MKKLFPMRISVIMTFCILLFFSCTSDLELPPLPPPDSIEQGSSSSFSNSSSGTSNSSSSFVFCQIESNCVPLPEANCIYPVGLVVPSCELTCELSVHIVHPEVAIHPQPVVKCNDIEVSRDIIWTPEDLIFTSADTEPQSVSAKVPNCNNATANCGEVIVF